MAGLTVLVDHCMQRATVVAGGRGKDQSRIRVRRNAKTHRQGADRVEASHESRGMMLGWVDLRVGCSGGQGIEPGQRLARIMVATEPALAVSLTTHANDLRVGVSQKMCGH